MAVTVQVNSSEWRLIAAHSTEHGCCAVPTATTLRKTCDEGSRQQVRDLVTGDYIDRTPPFRFASTIEAILSNDRLEQVLRADLRNLGGGPVADAMVTRFMSGSGQMYEHANGTPLSNLARQSPNFRRFEQDALRLIWQGLQREGLATDRRQYTFYLRSQDFGWCEFSDTSATIGSALMHQGFTPEPSQVLRVVIGGTSGFKIFMRSLRIERRERTRDLQANFALRFEICDHFGADEDDHYTAGLRALWLLQHARRGDQKPFCNLIVIEQDYRLPILPVMTVSGRVRG